MQYRVIFLLKNVLNQCYLKDELVQELMLQASIVFPQNIL